MVHDQCASSTGTDVDSQEWHKPNFLRRGGVRGTFIIYENTCNSPRR
jgi:hypothetical protein